MVIYYIGQRLGSETMIPRTTLEKWFSQGDCQVGMEKQEMTCHNTTVIMTNIHLTVQTSTKCIKLVELVFFFK